MTRADVLVTNDRVTCAMVTQTRADVLLVTHDLVSRAALRACHRLACELVKQVTCDIL